MNKEQNEVQPSIAFVFSLYSQFVLGCTRKISFNGQTVRHLEIEHLTHSCLSINTDGSIFLLCWCNIHRLYVIQNLVIPCIRQDRFLVYIVQDHYWIVEVYIGILVFAPVCCTWDYYYGFLLLSLPI